MENSFVWKTKNSQFVASYSLMIFVSIRPILLIVQYIGECFYWLQTWSHNRHRSKKRLSTCITISSLLLPFRMHLDDASILVRNHSSLWTEYSQQSIKPVLLLDLKYPRNIHFSLFFFLWFPINTIFALLFVSVVEDSDTYIYLYQ